MPKTAWQIAPYYTGVSPWLRTDGSTVTPPAVETTPAQRRWRVVGQDASVTHDNLRQHVLQVMQNRARTEGTSLWIELLDPVREIGEHANLVLSSREAIKDFTFARSPKIKFTPRTNLPIAFEFVHRDYPIRAILWVVLLIDDAGHASVTTALTYRSTTTWPSFDNLGICRYRRDEWQDRYSCVDPLGALGGRVKFGNQRFPSLRSAVSRFLEVVGTLAAYGQVSIPDRRNVGAALTLQAARTNYSDGFYRELLEFIQVAPALERLRSHLDGIVSELNRLGIVTQHDTRHTLTKLAQGKLSELRVAITPQESDSVQEDGFDPYHKVVLDLTRGVALVTCLGPHLNDAAELWNVAKFKADLAGNTEALLAYAQAQTGPAERARLARVARERRINPPK